MDRNVQHKPEPAAWTGACSMDSAMQHEHGYGRGQDVEIDYFWNNADS
jgi:hypothetical protein